MNLYECIRTTSSSSKVHQKYQDKVNSPGAIIGMVAGRTWPLGIYFRLSR